MNEWQLTRYLIDSKKCIDSLLYIELNFNKIINLDLREIIESKLRLFYINLCVVLDYSFSRKERKELKKNDKIVEKIYYERDKNYAHKDIDYEKIVSIELSDIVHKVKKELEYCFELCRKKLPSNITIDYVSYDRNLFRFANSITPLIEEQINKTLYRVSKKENGKKYNIFDDTEDLKYVDNKNDYAIIIENGLILKEGLQNRQDSCIKFNVLHDENMWCGLLKNSEEIFGLEEKAFIKMLNDIK